jgi:hypothetical protein
MLNRAPYTSLVVIRKQPFYHWLAMADQLEGSMDDYTHAGDYTTYLTDEDLNTPEEIEAFMDIHYREIFEKELDLWHKRSLWPEPLTREMFDEWFRITINREVFYIV